ncbi:MAG: hypothetical protein KRP56_05280 [Candidatus Methanogranum gryphiswaldense]|nr:MAG: hypothetical protein KRP56_05280 [Candidatus Methanogranum sp. U3.2.1]
MTFDCINADYEIELRTCGSEIIFRGDRRGCFNRLIIMKDQERDSAVVIVKNINSIDKSHYDISMTAKDFINANIEDILRCLALEQGLEENHYLKLRQMLENMA